MASAQRRGEIRARLREVKKRQPVARAVAVGGEGLQGRVQVHQVTGLVRRARRGFMEVD
uniref:Uncharacterized protein n=1 Tax=Oryza barthii TaxID=65489 RepID=A0A0D3G4R9_9ORYZ